MTVLVGIDPGLAETGFGVIEIGSGSSRFLDAGTIRTPAGEALATRLLAISTAVREILEKQRASFAVVEELFFARNALSVMGVAQARGVILLAAAQTEVPVAEYTPLQVKQAVTGNGRAEKAQVHRMVEILLGGTLRLSRPEGLKTSHEADALALALCHAHGSAIESRIQQGLGATQRKTAMPPGYGKRRR